MQRGLHQVTIEDFVPQDHFLRKLDGALDLSFVYEETADLYHYNVSSWTGIKLSDA